MDMVFFTAADTILTANSILSYMDAIKHIWLKSIKFDLQLVYL